jgi:hypothetical protein
MRRASKISARKRAELLDKIKVISKGAGRERVSFFLRSNTMASKVRQSTRDLARQITRAVYEATDGHLRRWRMLSGIPDATDDAVLYAVDQGWLELEGNHSACLTEEGRRLIAREAH